MTKKLNIEETVHALECAFNYSEVGAFEFIGLLEACKMHLLELSREE